MSAGEVQDQANKSLVPGDYIVRVAWEDRFPAGANLQDAARDSVIRFAMHYGYQFVWVHDQYGERWRHGAPTGVHGWWSEARVTGLLPR
jgi:hypothetical protein